MNWPWQISKDPSRTLSPLTAWDRSRCALCVPRTPPERACTKTRAVPTSVLLWLPAPLCECTRASRAVFSEPPQGPRRCTRRHFWVALFGPSFSCCGALLRRRSDGQPAKDIPEIALIPSPTPAGCRTCRECSLDQPNWETRSLFGKRGRGAQYILLMHTEVADGLSPNGDTF